VARGGASRFFWIPCTNRVHDCFYLSRPAVTQPFPHEGLRSKVIQPRDERVHEINEYRVSAFFSYVPKERIYRINLGYNVFST
jgi:hypothetical protein